MYFRFRVWSTRSNAVIYTPSQDEALFNLHNSSDFDRVDYREIDDGQGWRFVSPDDLQRVCIEDIYHEDKKRDGCRNLVYILLGIALACIGVILLFS